MAGISVTHGRFSDSFQLLNFYMYTIRMQIIAEEKAGVAKYLRACLRALLLEWLKNNPQLEDLLTALESPVVNRADIAEDLKGKFASKELIL